ncbi:hypothetical protein AMATHDRAFT_90296, partial [Amanita thiersii Skay4041]
MRAALAKQASLMGDPSIAKRDPLSSLSFSCLPSNVVQTQTSLLKHYRKRKDSAFSPTGSDGQPIRRYSDRNRELWSFGGTAGLSIKGPSVP